MEKENYPELCKECEFHKNAMHDPWCYSPTQDGAKFVCPKKNCPNNRDTNQLDGIVFPI